MNRESELAALERWWGQPGASIALLWGRRRVGKTALVERFSAGRPAVFHTGAGRPRADELRLLSRAAARVVGERLLRDLEERPFVDWDDALETLAETALDDPVLLVLDELPELLESSPELEGVLRSAWDRIRTRTKLRVLLSGSAVRTMAAIQEERSPLYGRLDLALLLRPFQPHEAALMVPRLAPSEQALVWGLVGGVPLYLGWWDDGACVRANVRRLVCTPDGLLLTAGELALSSELDAGDLSRQVLYAIAAGRTKHHEIAAAVRADPTRTLERLVSLGLVERLVPVTEDPRRTRRRVYRISDNFLAFWLGVVDRHRSEIERGLGATILPVLMRDLDDFMGPRWEEAFRHHLRRLAAAGALGDDVVAVGPFWTAGEPPVEIDAVALAGRQRAAVLVGEAKWSRRVDGVRLARALEDKARSLPRARRDLQVAVCAREEVVNSEGLLAITAEDVFRSA